MPLQRSKLLDWDDLLIPLFVPLLLVGRADPECMLGHLLRILFKNDDFMNAVGLLLSFIQIFISRSSTLLYFINSLLSPEALTNL